MRTLSPSMSLQTRLYGPLLIGLSVVLILIGPIAWPWRLMTALAGLLWGSWLWRRHLRRRPLALRIGPRGELSCSCADEPQLTVSHVLPGLLHPRLIAVRLETDGGGYRDLFIPGDALDPEQHWQLRRTLMGFRQDQSDSRLGT